MEVYYRRKRIGFTEVKEPIRKVSRQFRPRLEPSWRESQRKTIPGGKAGKT
jgi:hypothetical protein